MKIAIAQIACAPGEPKTNLRQVRDFSTSARARGADLVVFPEMCDTGYTMPAIKQHATAWDTGAVPELRKFAQTLSIAIVCGVSEREGDRTYNSQVFIGPRGEILAKYRKCHLFAVPPVKEDECFAAGDAVSVVEFGGWRFGLSICYDLRFPEIYRAQAADKGANVFIISSAWPFVRAKHLQALLVARAIENQSYVVASNRVGTDDEVTFCGSSVIIDPNGAVLDSASPDRDELIQSELSEEVIKKTRDRMPVFAHRRPELFK
jgi:omega-amidase